MYTIYLRSYEDIHEQHLEIQMLMHFKLTAFNSFEMSVLFWEKEG